MDWWRARSAGTARHPQPGALSVGRASSGSTGRERTRREAHARAACRRRRHHERTGERFRAEPRLGSAPRARDLGAEIARRARLANALCRRSTATSRTSRGAGAPGPEAPAEQQEGGAQAGWSGKLGVGSRQDAPAVLESWIRPHPSAKARLGWREARSEHMSLPLSGSAEVEHCAAPHRSTGVRDGNSGSVAS